MELETVLRNRNAFNQVYMSDICEWLGDEAFKNIDIKKREELREKLTELFNED